MLIFYKSEKFLHPSAIQYIQNDDIELQPVSMRPGSNHFPAIPDNCCLLFSCFSNVVGRNLSTLVQPRCMSRLLQRRGPISEPTAWVRSPAVAKVINIFYLLHLAPSVNNPFNGLGAYPCSV